MVVNSKIRDSDWLTFKLTIVNFNYVFIQPAHARSSASKIVGGKSAINNFIFGAFTVEIARAVKIFSYHKCVLVVEILELVLGLIYFYCFSIHSSISQNNFSPASEICH